MTAKIENAVGATPATPQNVNDPIATQWDNGDGYNYRLWKTDTGLFFATRWKAGVNDGTCDRSPASTVQGEIWPPNKIWPPKSGQGSIAPAPGAPANSAAPKTENWEKVGDDKRDVFGKGGGANASLWHDKANNTYQVTYWYGPTKEILGKVPVKSPNDPNWTGLRSGSFPLAQAPGATAKISTFQGPTPKLNDLQTKGKTPIAKPEGVKLPGTKIDAYRTWGPGCVGKKLIEPRKDGTLVENTYYASPFQWEVYQKAKPAIVAFSKG